MAAGHKKPAVRVHSITSSLKIKHVNRSRGGSISGLNPNREVIENRDLPLWGLEIPTKPF